LAPRDGGSTRDRIVLHTPSVVSRLMPPVSETQIADAFIADQFDISGNTVAVLHQAASWRGPSLARSSPRALRGSLLERIATHADPDLRAELGGFIHTPRRDAQAVRYHYDVSDAFYRLFLDQEMVYSCAYFPTGRESLAEAQRAKLDLVCRKLDLRRG